jgi:RNA polymerase sigma factor for flagellar operon FliA
LISAVDHFDGSRRVKLKTYAEYKIRGAILDSLREMDWASARRRRKARKIERAIAAAGQRLQQSPGEEEIAGELGLTLDEYRRWLRETRGLILERVAAAPEPVEPTALLAGILQRWDAERLLRSAARLPAPERSVLRLYYGEGWTLREIARAVHLDEARVSQLKSAGLRKLRRQVRPAPRMLHSGK